MRAGGPVDAQFSGARVLRAPRLCQACRHRRPAERSCKHHLREAARRREPPLSIKRRRGRAARPVYCFFMSSLDIASLSMLSLFLAPFFMASFFIESPFIASPFMASPFMASPFISSLCIESLFIESVAMESFFIESCANALPAMKSMVDSRAAAIFMTIPLNEEIEQTSNERISRTGAGRLTDEGRPVRSHLRGCGLFMDCSQTRD